MKRLHLIIGFVSGFILATVIGLVLILPASKDAWQINMDSDVLGPLEGAFVDIEKSATQGDCEKAAAQLGLLKKRFAEYRAGGPAPASWWNEVVATTQPAR